MENGELTLWCNLLRVTHLQMRNRRGEHCSPAARPEPAQGTAAARPEPVQGTAAARPEPVQGTAKHTFNHSAGAQCAPLQDT